MSALSSEAPASPNPSAAPSAKSITVPGKAAEIITLPLVSARAADAKAIVVPGAAKGGKVGKEGADYASITHISLSNRAFLDTIFVGLPQNARTAIAAKDGDPSHGGWLPLDGAKVDEVCRDDRNTYFNCSSFRLTTGDALQARKDATAAYHVLMLDDVGTKVDRAALCNLQPTWEIETSPGNFQIGFRLEPVLTDPAAVEALQAKFSSAELTDKGALNMVRWARLPNGINGKAKYSTKGKPFRCRLHAWNPGIAYSADRLMQAVGPVQKKGAPVLKRDNRSRTASSGNGVFFPAQPENPVLTAFKASGLYKREISTGRHDVTCPWVEEHTDRCDTGAAYFEPSEQYACGGFKCMHSHGDALSIAKVLDHFELSEGQARNRPLIRAVAGELKAVVSHVEQVLATRGDLYQSGGIIVSVRTNPFTGDVEIKPVSEAELTLAMSAACEWEKYDSRSKQWTRCDPTERHVKMVFKAEEYAYLPRLTGFARQPFYRADCAELVTEAGYDAKSHRLGIFDPKKFERPVAGSEGAKEALALLQELVSEFHFAAEHDRSAALCAMLTATVRPALNLAPAFHVTAPSPGSGKSYLCETISLFAGPGASAKISYPRTSEEATKVILSTLLAAPAVIEFDDMDTDWYPHGAINRMLTATTVSDRLLGYSKMATVSTTALVLGSGNNVGPLKDLARRVLTINLNAKSEAPATLTYKANPVAMLKTNRERYVAAALTIIEAWKAAGRPVASVPSIASYGGAWSSFCRQPLIWLGLPDPATTLLDQLRTNPDSDVLQRFLEEWYRAFGDKAVTVRAVVATYQEDLTDALLDLPVLDGGKINRSKLGWYLKKNQHRIAGGLSVVKAESTERNAWKVVKAGEGETSLPSSPTSSRAGEPDVTITRRRNPEDAF